MSRSWPPNTSKAPSTSGWAARSPSSSVKTVRVAFWTSLLPPRRSGPEQLLARARYATPLSVQPLRSETSAVERGVSPPQLPRRPRPPTTRPAYVQRCAGRSSWSDLQTQPSGIIVGPPFCTPRPSKPYDPVAGCHHRHAVPALFAPTTGALPPRLYPAVLPRARQPQPSGALDSINVLSPCPLSLPTPRSQRCSPSSRRHGGGEGRGGSRHAV